MKNVVVITAMDVEFESVVADRATKRFVLSETLRISAAMFENGGKTFKVFNSGIGPVSAALSLGLAIDKQEPDAVFLAGVGGALVPGLEIGDVVVAESVTQHDSIISGDRGNRIITPGVLPAEITLSSESTNPEHLPVIATDFTLTKLLFDGFIRKGHRAVLGKMVSGNEFVGRSARKAELSQTHGGAKIVDMEAGAIAQICRKYKIPFAVAKTVADRVEPDGSIASDFVKFTHSAAKRAADIIDVISFN